LELLGNLVDVFLSILSVRNDNVVHIEENQWASRLKHFQRNSSFTI
jgi:hypothetical protein